MIDLHAHTHFSDGTDIPEELARMGEAAGLSALALTDHDTLDGLSRFLAMQPGLKVRLVPGTEISCGFLGRSLHVLGLLIDPTDPVFRTRLTELRERRTDRNVRMIRQLQSMGIQIEMEDVQRHADSPLLSRVHFAHALVDKGAASSKEDAFKRLLGDGCPGCVPREELAPEAAARWIREAGGVPIVAHPGRFGRGFLWEEAMPDLQRRGMAGFEAYYGGYSQAEQEYFVALAGRLGMTMSGGSDYHGSNKPGLSVGVGRGGLRVPDTVLEGLDRAQAEGSWH